MVMGWGGNWLHLVLDAIQQDFPRGLHVGHLLGQILFVVLIILVIQQVLPRPLLKLPLWGEADALVRLLAGVVEGQRGETTNTPSSSRIFLRSSAPTRDTRGLGLSGVCCFTSISKYFWRSLKERCSGLCLPPGGGLWTDQGQKTGDYTRRKGPRPKQNLQLIWKKEEESATKDPAPLRTSEARTTAGSPHHCSSQAPQARRGGGYLQLHGRPAEPRHCRQVHILLAGGHLAGQAPAHHQILLKDLVHQLRLKRPHVLVTILSGYHGNQPGWLCQSFPGRNLKVCTHPRLSNSL